MRLAETRHSGAIELQLDPPGLVVRGWVAPP
jgi:hypothetical protein